MKTIFFFIFALGLGGVASGTTYYVSSSLGNDASSGVGIALRGHWWR